MCRGVVARAAATTCVVAGMVVGIAGCPRSDESSKPNPRETGPRTDAPASPGYEKAGARDASTGVNSPGDNTTTGGLSAPPAATAPATQSTSGHAGPPS
jgi:hypothetical protein